MGDELAINFLDWLTESGRVRLWYQSQEGRSDELWLGAKQVTHSDLARVARHWSGGGNLSPETAGVLVGLALEKVSTSSGREWHSAK